MTPECLLRVCIHVCVSVCECVLVQALAVLSALRVSVSWCQRERELDCFYAGCYRSYSGVTALRCRLPWLQQLQECDCTALQATVAITSARV